MLGSSQRSPRTYSWVREGEGKRSVGERRGKERRGKEGIPPN